MLIGYFCLSAPKVSSDGEPHGLMTLVAVGSGVVVACVILIVLTNLVYRKKSANVTPNDKYEKRKRRFFCNLRSTLENGHDAIPKSVPQIAIISDVRKDFDNDLTIVTIDLDRTTTTTIFSERGSF